MEGPHKGVGRSGRQGKSAHPSGEAVGGRYRRHVPRASLIWKCWPLGIEYLQPPKVRYRKRKPESPKRPGEQEVVINGEPVATAWKNTNGQWLAATIAFSAHPLRPHKTRRAAVQALINMEVIPKAQP